MFLTMVVIKVLDSFPLLEHLIFDPIPLSRVVKSEVSYKSVWRLTLVNSLSRRAHTIGNRSGIPHQPSQRIKGPISWSRIDNPMTQKIIQDTLVGG